MQTESKSVDFEEAFLPHRDAAYNLARWLTRNEHDAEDVVQEAYLRALKFFHKFHGSDGRPWFLTIVRHTCYSWLKRNKSPELSYEFDEALHLREADESDPESSLLRNTQQQLIAQAMEKLPVEFRQVMVLRELEELSYKEIAAVAGIPVGTVMSRLTRARKKLQASISEQHSVRTTRTSAQLAVNNVSAEVMS